MFKRKLLLEIGFAPRAFYCEHTIVFLSILLPMHPCLPVASFYLLLFKGISKHFFLAAGWNNSYIHNVAFSGFARCGRVRISRYLIFPFQFRRKKKSDGRNAMKTKECFFSGWTPKIYRYPEILANFDRISK